MELRGREAAQSLGRIGGSPSYALGSAASSHAMPGPHAFDGTCGKTETERKEMKQPTERKCSPPEGTFDENRDRCAAHIAAAKGAVETELDEYVHSPVATLFEFATSLVDMAGGTGRPVALLDTLGVLENELDKSRLVGFMPARALLERAAVYAQRMGDTADSVEETA